MIFYFVNIIKICKMTLLNSPRFIKWQTYIITFISYVALHTMRMSFSQVKSKFKDSFQQSNLFLGLFDALVYIALGTGFFFRFLLQGKKNLKSSLLLYLTIACLGYLIIPITSLILGTGVRDNFLFQEFLPGFGLLIFGFFQFPAWPTLLTLTNDYFNLQKQGTALGIWSANGDIGNIIGFAMCGLLVDNLNWRWQIAMIIASGLNWIMALMVFFFVKEKTHSNEIQDRLLNDQIKQQNSKSKFKQFLQFSKQVISTTENKLYLLSMGLLKSILYGFLLWMPTYLTHIDLSAYKSTIPIVFNAGTVIGSFILGYFYEDMDVSGDSLVSSIKRNIKQYSLFYSCIGLTVLLTIFYTIQPNVVAYFILSAVCGAFLGGCFNMLASNQVIALTGGKKEDVNKLSTLTMVVGNWMVGIVEIIIGVVLDLKDDAEGQKKLFPILVAVGIVAITILFIRSYLISKRLRVEINSEEKKQNVK